MSSDADSESDADDSESEDDESEELLEELLVGDGELETSLSSDSGRVGAICDNFDVDCFLIGEMDRLFEASWPFRPFSTFSFIESTSIFSAESDSSEDSSLSSLSLSSDSSLLSDAELADEEVAELSRSSSESCCEEEDGVVGDDTSLFEADNNFVSDLVAPFPLAVVIIGAGVLVSGAVEAFRFPETVLSFFEALAFLDAPALICVSVLVTGETAAGWTDEELSVTSFCDCAFPVVVRFFVTFPELGSGFGAESLSFPLSPLFSGELLIWDFFFPPADVKMTTSGLAFRGNSGASICIAFSLSSDASTPFLELRGFLFGSSDVFLGEALCFLSFSGVSGILESCSSEVSRALSEFWERVLFFPGRTALSGDAGISISSDLLRLRCDDDGGANSFSGFPDGISGDLPDCSICIFERASLVNGVGDCST